MIYIRWYLRHFSVIARALKASTSFPVFNCFFFCLIRQPGSSRLIFIHNLGHTVLLSSGCARIYPYKFCLACTTGDFRDAGAGFAMRERELRATSAERSACATMRALLCTRTSASMRRLVSCVFWRLSFTLMKGYTAKMFVFTTFYDLFDILFVNIILLVISLKVSHILNELFLVVSVQDWAVNKPAKSPGR